MANPLPALNSAGTYTSLPPFNSIISPKAIYYCRGIRKLSDYIASNQDPLTTIYEPVGLTEAEYNTDLVNDVDIISLQNNESVWVIVPSSYLVSYPVPNGINYRSVALVSKLPIIREDLDLSFLMDEISSLITDKIGVQPEIELVETSQTISLTETEETSLKASRAINDRLSKRGKILKLSEQVAALTLEKQALLDYIQTH